jgi:ATP-dependent 26S proteasome regulatory subunit
LCEHAVPLPPFQPHADKEIDIGKITPGARVALRNDSYTLHVLLPTKVDPLVSLMKVEKVPDSTYDMVGGLDQQIKEIKEVRVGGGGVGGWVGGGGSMC